MKRSPIVVYVLLAIMIVTSILMFYPALFVLRN